MHHNHYTHIPWHVRATVQVACVYVLLYKRIHQFPTSRLGDGGRGVTMLHVDFSNFHGSCQHIVILTQLYITCQFEVVSISLISIDPIASCHMSLKVHVTMSNLQMITWPFRF